MRLGQGLRQLQQSRTDIAVTGKDSGSETDMGRTMAAKIGQGSGRQAGVSE